MRRLPGPAGHRLGEGGDSRGFLRIVSGLAENTNSIFCDGSAEPEAANGCPVLLESRNHQPRGIRAQPKILQNPATRSRERAQRTRAFLLTMTYMDGGDSPGTPEFVALTLDSLPPRSICRRLFDVVDHQHRQRAFFLLQLQAQLIFDSVRQRDTPTRFDSLLSSLR